VDNSRYVQIQPYFATLKRRPNQEQVAA
jgi:hypothetical protein